MGYVSVSEVRPEGLEDASKYPDARIQKQIDLWSGYVDRTCRQWFEPRSITALFDGNDSDTLLLPVPIISVSALYINGDFSAPLDPTEFFVYSGRAFPDDRLNPRVKLLSQDRDIFRSRFFGRGFVGGKQNQKVVGQFGYTEPDGSTPELIKRAVIKMVIRNIPSIKDNQSEIGPVAFEMTDGHSVQYLTPEKFGLKSSGFAVTKDAEVDQILSMFRAPVGITVTGSSIVQVGVVR